MSVADICCGMNAHAAILQALIERQSTGRARGISVSLFDGIADWLTVPLLHQDYGGRAPGRVGLKHPSIAPYGAFASADGRDVVIAIQNEREWIAFCEKVLERPEIGADPQFTSNSLRCTNRQALEAEIVGIFAQLPADAIVGRCQEAGTAYASLNTIADLSSHPQLRRINVETSTGAVSLPAPPVRWDDDAPSPLAVPGIGQHDAAIRAEFAGPI